ncbi:hypothetical protein J9317_10935 [Metabacillus sp. KIGAM252]|uniref:Uncharacterized protein n=1 Tax=Metabacillus flavus TaxID=2823519 RepID=A0ABS5LEW4_9BACI|nr:hypothetical protein [Metabacillus flavus]MBS2969279.1 hypothetical protein [Metabacillus flavus]
MNRILDWADGEHFDRILIAGVRILFTIAVVGCLPFIGWKIAVLLLNSL